MAETTPVRPLCGASAPLSSRAVHYRWLPYLTLGLLLELSALFYFIPQDPALLARIQRLGWHWRELQDARHLAALMRSDPRLGENLQTQSYGQLKVVLQRFSARGPVLLLFVGPCTSCNAKLLQNWRELAEEQPGRPIVLASRDSEPAIRKFMTSQRFPLPIIADRHGELAKLFNAIWVPRAYAITNNGRVTWIQKNPYSGPQVIAREVWPGGTGG